MNNVPTIPEHPSWCSPPECDVDNELEGFGAHRSVPLLLNLGFQVMTDVTLVRVQLQEQARPWPTPTHLTVEAGRARATLEVADARRMHREVGALLAEVENTEDPS